jgi:hypothetical protein
MTCERFAATLLNPIRVSALARLLQDAFSQAGLAFCMPKPAGGAHNRFIHILSRHPLRRGRALSGHCPAPVPGAKDHLAASASSYSKIDRVKSSTYGCGSGSLSRLHALIEKDFFLREKPGKYFTRRVKSSGIRSSWHRESKPSGQAVFFSRET